MVINCFSFCKYFKHVISAEIDENRFKILQNNINNYNYNNHTIIHCDAVKEISKLKREIDVIFIDAPWGGPEYKSDNDIQITLSGLELDEIVKLASEYNYNNPLFSYHLATRNLWVYPFNDDFENKMEIIKLYYPLLQKYNFNEKSFNDIKKEIQIKQDNIEQDSFNKREILNGFLHKKYDGEPIIKFLQVNLKPQSSMLLICIYG